MAKKHVEKHGSLPAETNESGEKGEKKKEKVTDRDSQGEKSKKQEED